MTKSTISIQIQPEFGWTYWHDDGRDAWFKGYILRDRKALDGTAAAAYLAGVLDLSATPEALGNTVALLDGSFAFVIDDGKTVLAAVDRMRSIPLFHATDKSGTAIDGQALRLRDARGLVAPCPDGSTEFAMAGYTMGETTLYAGMKQIPSGHIALFRHATPGLSPTLHCYYAYRSWETDDTRDFPRLQKYLTSITRHMFEKMVAGLDGRPIMAPLSAGLDSRLVVSALSELGVKNVICYAYGRPGNFEAVASRQIAERLGYPWHFVPYSPAIVQENEKSVAFREYIAFSDSCASLPFLQDMAAIRALKQRNIVPADAVFINGNSGDFITGGHIPKELHETPVGLTPNARRERICKAQINKHYSLWRALRLPENLTRIQRLLMKRLMTAVPSLPDPVCDPGLYEFLECHARQANFVITGQRVYEYFGHDWRLPLWDNDYLDFWAHVPFDAKFGQKLYRAFLKTENWGGVWQGIEDTRYLSPRWIALPRNIVKLAAAPLGRERWHVIDKHIFAYWTDILSVYGAVPYSKVLFDQRGFRNALSFRAEAHLATHGRRYDGAMMEAC